MTRNAAGAIKVEEGGRLKSWSVVIPDYFPPSPNELGTGSKRRFVEQRHKRRACDHVMVYGGSLPQFHGRVRVTITRRWGYRQRALDKDNLYGSCKFLLDCLRAPKRGQSKRRLSIIEDDAPHLCELIVNQEKGEDRQHSTLIEIESLEQVA